MDRKKTKLLTFDNNQQKRFIYSGYSGLILEYTPRIENYINSACSEDKVVENYLFHDPFAEKREVCYHEDPFIEEITIFTTNQCNLKCSYCYEKETGLAGFTEMNLDTLKNSVEFMLKRFGYGDHIRILFFGGEPLLNFPLVKESVKLLKKIEEERKIQFSYSITTNGTILEDDIIEFLIRENFRVMISVDGNKEMHDYHRKFKDGGNSYDVIAKHVKTMAEYIDIQARFTLTQLDTDLIQTYEDLIALGFFDVKVALVSKKDSMNNNSDEFEKFSKQMQRLSEYCLQNIKNRRLIRINNLLWLLSTLHYGSKKSPKFFPCSAGISSYSIAVNGDIYLCHRFNNCSDYKLGSTFKGFDNDKRISFLKSHIVYQRDLYGCNSCWARYLCGGNCYNSSYFSCGDTYKTCKNTCHFNQEFIKSALYIYTSLSDQDRVVLGNISQMG